jgi:hypothetical protein
MAGTFRDGIEAAARKVEGLADSASSAMVAAHLAAEIRAIEEPAFALDAIEDGFQQFKSIWPKGPRNHWTPAKAAFVRAVKKRRHAISAILTGTAAYAATRPEFQYIPAPAVFLNQDRFLTDYRPPNGRGPTGNRAGASSLFQLEEQLSGARQSDR